MSVRLDQWLWAARFFKTRSLAKEAIEGGKVHFQTQRPKVSKTVQVGDIYTIRQGYDERVVKVLALGEVRREAKMAQTLYEETPESLSRRLAAVETRKLLQIRPPDHKPSKQDRQKIISFKRSF